MVVCKFFQQGYCRYAQNCRFEHVYGSKYTYNANPQPQNGVTDEYLLNQIHSDVNAALKGGQWMLSCYAPFKEKPALPGLIDLSPEEARLFIYEAKANNTIDQAVVYMNNLFKEAKAKYEQLLLNSPPIIKVITNLYKGDTVTSPFSNTQNAFGNSNSTSATSIFHSAVQNTGAFGQNAGNSALIFSQNPATSPDGSTAKSIFAQATQKAFGPSQTSSPLGSTQNQNVFSSNQTSNQNIFAPSQNSGSVFGSPTSNTAAKSLFAQAAQNSFGASQPMQNPSNVFASASQQFFGTSNRKTEQSPFAQNQNSSPFEQVQTSPFGTASNNLNNQFSANNIFQTANTGANVFGMTVTKPQQIDGEGIYSNIEDLSKIDLEAFKSVDFKLGFVPEIAPPAELCVNG